MKVKDFCSSGLRTGATLLKVIGILGVIGAVLAWTLDGPGLILLISGVLIFFAGVLFKGLYPISLAAEHRLAELGDSDFREEDIQK